MRRNRFCFILCIVAAVAVFTIVHALKVVSNQVEMSLDQPPSDSAEEARIRGIFICDVRVDRNDTSAPDGRKIVLSEAWIEEARRLEYRWVWFPHYRRLDYNNVCLRMGEESQGKQALAPSSHWPFLVQGSQVRAFSQWGVDVFSAHLDANDFSAKTVSLLDRSDDHACDITLTPEKSTQ